MSDESVELFGIMRRLPEITISSGKLAVNKLSELAHDSSIISLYQFMWEDLEVSRDQFKEGCALLLAKMNSEDGILSAEDTIVGYVRCADDSLTTLSCDGQHLCESDPEDPEAVWPPGTLIISPAFSVHADFSKSTISF